MSDKTIDKLAEVSEIERLLTINAELLNLIKWAFADPDSEVLGDDWNNAAEALIAKAEGRV